MSVSIRIPSVRASSIPGDRRRRVTRAYAGLPQDAEYVPLSGGHDHLVITVLRPPLGRVIVGRFDCVLTHWREGDEPTTHHERSDDARELFGWQS